MSTIEAEQDKHMKTVARYHDTMTERFNDPTYGRMNRDMMMEAFFKNVENHRERFWDYQIVQQGEHLDRRRV